MEMMDEEYLDEEMVVNVGDDEDWIDFVEYLVNCSGLEMLFGIEWCLLLMPTDVPPTSVLSGCVGLKTLLQKNGFVCAVVTNINLIW